MIWIALGAVVLLVIVVIVMKRGGGGSGGFAFRPGTRAFEASLTMDPLVKTIASRKQELAGQADSRKKDRLMREIAFLEKQIPELQTIIDAKDLSPGKGYVGFENLPAD